MKTLIVLFTSLLVFLSASCGVKGPPLPPLDLPETNPPTAKPSVSPSAVPSPDPRK